MKTITLGVIFTITVLITTGLSTSYAMSSEPGGDVRNSNASYDIRNFGINDSGNPYVLLYGDAGATKPTTEGIIHAYMLFTDAGVFAVTSHTGIADSSIIDDGEWHANKVVLENNCIVSITEDIGVANIGNKEVSVTGSDASIVFLAVTVEFTAADDICITNVFDSAI